MSYDHILLIQQVSMCLQANPNISLKELSKQVRVSPRTLETVILLTTAQRFRKFREQMLMDKVEELIRSERASTVKELAFEVGYRSSRSFARAIKRLSGASPRALVHKLRRQRESVGALNGI